MCCGRYRAQDIVVLSEMMGNSFLLIVVGLFLFYLVVSNKWRCVELFAACLIGKTNSTSNVSNTTFTVPNINTNLQTLPNVNSLIQNSNWVINNGI